MLWLVGGGRRPGYGWWDALGQSGVCPEVLPSDGDLVRVQRHRLHRLPHDGVMTFLSLQSAGAVAICSYGTPGSVKGTTGHPHGIDGCSSSGKFPSATLMPGQPPNWASGFLKISRYDAGKMRIWNFRMIPRLPSDVPESSHIMRAVKSVMFNSACLSASSTTVPSGLWNEWTIWVDDT